MVDSNKPTVLITGVTGFLGHMVLLEFVKGEGRGQFNVRGTVRDKNNEKKMKPLKEMLGDDYDKVEFVNADLMNAVSLMQACEGCTYVVHTASPVPAHKGEKFDDVVNPAVYGTNYVMMAARAHKVKRVVLTSSIAAVCGYTKDKMPTHFNESNWSQDERIKDEAYLTAKTRAEKCAWEHQKASNGEMELVTICPSIVLGEFHSYQGSSSSAFVEQMMTGKMPMTIHTGLMWVDVLDVTKAHYRALVRPEAANKRFILDAGMDKDEKWFDELPIMLEAGLKEQGRGGYPLPKRVAGPCLMGFMSYFSKDAKAGYDLIGQQFKFDNTAAKKDLGLEFKRTCTDILVAAADSLIKLKVVEDKKLKK